MADPTPRFPIRRFDVFAEYNRILNLAHGMPPDIARGRGIWVAKVVAGRGRGSAPAAREGTDRESGKGDKREEDEDDGFRSIGGEVQTDATFEKEIVERMGRDFYEKVFSPAIEAAHAEGKRYEDIRDSIRKDWK